MPDGVPADVPADAVDGPPEAPEATEARAAMVERLRETGVIASPAVEAAMATVPRHRFLEGFIDGPSDRVGDGGRGGDRVGDGTMEVAYADIAVTVKVTADGTAISSASQPTIVASMLELAELEPGHRVLEIGTGTGYNAALLASIVGRDGHVVSIELDEDLADRARARLRRFGFADIDVVTADGAGGHPEGAPFDRIVVTTGPPALAPAWVDQLRSGGRLVTPIVDASGIGAIHCLVKAEDGLRDEANLPCGFLPMRGP